MEADGGSENDPDDAERVVFARLEANLDALVARALAEGDTPLSAGAHEVEVRYFAASVLSGARLGGTPGGLHDVRAAGVVLGTAFEEMTDAILVTESLVSAVGLELQQDEVGLVADVARRITRVVLIGLAAGTRAHIELRLLSRVTHLPQLAAFERDLAARIAEVEANGHHLCLVFMDLDGLKLINDSEGHTRGDEAIRALAEAARPIVDVPAASLYHLHGDEFVLILEGDLVTSVEVFLNQIRSRAYWLDHDGGRVPLAFSAGIARYPDDGTTVRDLKDAADDRMQAQKPPGPSRREI